MTEEEVKEELIPTEEPKEEVQEKEPDRGTDFLLHGSTEPGGHDKRLFLVRKICS